MTKLLHPTKFSSLQLELLRTYALNPSEDELLRIKTFLAKLFAEKLSHLAQKAADEKGITDDDLDAWLNEDEQ
jgi:hypothetical protein